MATEGEVLPFEAWMKELDKIADQHGLDPAPEPRNLGVWRRHYDSGRTPQQAWDKVPWRHVRTGATLL